MQIRKTKKPSARRIVVYGQEGVGKTTLAGMFPDAVFIDVEESTGEMDGVNAYDCRTMTEVRQAIALVKRSQFKTVIIDTVDWCEHAIADEMLAEFDKKSIEDFGFGKGYVMLSERIMDFLGLMDELREAGKNVVLLAHSTVKKVTPPDSPDSYDHYEMKLSKQASPLVKEWCDALLFYKFAVKVKKEEHRTRAIGGKDRVLCCQHTATADAKNRFGLPEFVNVITGATELPKELAALFAARPAMAPATTSTTTAKPGATAAPLKPAASESTGNATLARFMELIAGKEPATFRFLVARGQLSEGKAFADLSTDYLARVVSNADNFLGCVAEHAMQEANAELTDTTEGTRAE